MVRLDRPCSCSPSIAARRSMLHTIGSAQTHAYGGCPGRKSGRLELLPAAPRWRALFLGRSRRVYRHHSVTSMASITLPAFVRKWTASTRSERAAAHEHFIDLCGLLNQPTPNDDPSGESYAFEKGATKLSGGDGWADVWKRGCFAWEYKGKHKDLKAAYQQLQQYRDSLENPPLLVVCDLDRFEVHTNFTDTVHQVYAFNLAELAANVPTPTCPLAPLEVLRLLFTSPQALRPGRTSVQVTEQAAVEFSKLAESLRRHGVEPHHAAHFLVRVLFCLFAEDTGLLPGELFTKLVESSRAHPERLAPRLADLFGAMTHGGYFGADDIDHFDGGLFEDAPRAEDLPVLDAKDLQVLTAAVRLDWGSIEPAIFGTLFERSLDPNTRAKLGTQYTSRDDILLVVEPVLMDPLRRRWQHVQQQAQTLMAGRAGLRRERLGERGVERARNRLDAQVSKLLGDFAGELAAVHVLDPACGSGNFLYVALKRLLDLEKEVYEFALANQLVAPSLRVGPEQLCGIEVNPYAHELAQVVVWIGYIQWLRDNGFGTPSRPILKPLETIAEHDAVLDCDEHGHPREAAWPAADVIISNPPYLGGKRMRTELSDQYVDALFSVYQDRVPREADFVTYWFEKARAMIEAGRAKRAGLLGTQAIRRGANLRVLQRIKTTGDIFMAWSDRPWVLDGAAVRVSIVGFDDGSEVHRVLDGATVASINADLTAGLDLTTVPRLKENLGLSFMGTTKGGPFDIRRDVAERMLRAPINPNGCPNSDVVVPWINGLDITRRPRGMWIIDFGASMPEADAALYEQPFEYVVQHVKPARAASKTTQPYWWIHERPRAEMRAALRSLPRYIATSRVSRHRVFAWVPCGTLPDSRVYVFARDDDYFFGVLQSKVHVVWALAKASRHGVGNDPTYNNEDCFETFPFPWPPRSEPSGDPKVQAIAEAARELVSKRDAWLNPPGTTLAQLKDRTLTALYNQRPSWLDQLHQRLDDAVLDAYGWPRTLSDSEILERLLALNLARPAA